MNEKDKFKSLESVESRKSLSWVTNINKESEDWFKQNINYQNRYKTALEILEDKSQITGVKSYLDQNIYNFWKDEKNPKGLLRRMSYQSFINKGKNWETVLDIDELSKNENQSWVYKGLVVLNEKPLKTLVLLSKGGKDAFEAREFDLTRKEFIKNGFFIPEAKSEIMWLNKDELLLATDFGQGSLTTSGYPRIVKRLKRGEELSRAKYIFEAEKTDMGIQLYSEKLENGGFNFYISRSIDFYNDEKFIFKKDQSVIPIKLPTHFEIMATLESTIYAKPRKNYEFEHIKGIAGDLLKIDIHSEQGHVLNVRKIFSKENQTSLSSVFVTKNYIILNTLDNVKSKIKLIKTSNIMKPIDIKSDQFASIYVLDANKPSDEILYIKETFITPSELIYVNLKNLKTEKTLKSEKSFFNSSEFIVKQDWIKSKDGTRVPYFLIHKKNIKFDGQNKTLLYGYGGFEISMNPFYLGSIGKLWLEQNGVYVIANIRGGGEFGPAWHQAALKENRHKAFEDFIGVAEDLVHKNITSAKKLAIMGGSNGGLLVGAVMTKRPDLFKAVICQVPLLDMLNYHKLLAGASWMAEYGNPDIKEERNYLKTYSPYQNVKENIKYPSLFLFTSTKDDRVHPGHARKMAALFKDLKQDVLYFENIEGGHSGSTTYAQRAKQQAMVYSFLEEKLK